MTCTSFCIHGVEFNPHWFAGAGTGFESYLKESKEGRQLMSLTGYGVGRYTLRSGNSPYFDLRAGVNWRRNFKFVFNPSVGYRFSMPDNINMYVQIGYEGLTANNAEDDDIIDLRSMLSLRIGLEF